MSTYTPFKPMPMRWRALQTKVRHNRGLHIDFPYGTRHPDVPKKGEKYWQNEVPHPLYKGFTARAFFYAPEPSTPVYTEFDMYYHTPVTVNYYWSSAVIKGVQLWHHHSVVNGPLKGTEDDTKTTIDVPGYYSLAVRILDNEYFVVLYGEDQIGKDYQQKILNYKWLLRMAAGSHYLLSLHLSDELENNPDFPATQLGTSYYLYDPVLGIGSFWIMICMVVDTAKPLTVSIRLDDAGNKRYGTAEFPLTSVSQNDLVTIYIQNSTSGYLITTSFSPETKRIDHTNAPLQNYIHPFVSTNCQIMTQYCEQGAERV